MVYTSRMPPLVLAGACIESSSWPSKGPSIESAKKSRLSRSELQEKPICAYCNTTYTNPYNHGFFNSPLRDFLTIPTEIGGCWGSWGLQPGTKLAAATWSHPGNQQVAFKKFQDLLLWCDHSTKWWLQSHVTWWEIV